MDSLKNTTKAQKDSVNRWFQVLETKKALANISTRMCMTIENLVDLRLNKWKKHSKAGTAPQLRHYLWARCRAPDRPAWLHSVPPRSSPSTLFFCRSQNEDLIVN